MHRLVASSFLLLTASTIQGDVSILDFEAFFGTRFTCQQSTTIKSTTGASISGGQILRDNPGFAPVNRTAFYYTDFGCAGWWQHQPLFTIDFDFPTSSISLDLLHGEYEERTYVFSDDDGNTHVVPMEAATLYGLRSA